MQEAKKTQRPTQRKHQVNERRGIKRHRIPLSQERHATVIIWIPQREFSPPEAFALEMGHWVSKESVVANDECLQAKDYLGKSSENQKPQDQSETGRREPGAHFS